MELDCWASITALRTYFRRAGVAGAAAMLCVLSFAPLASPPVSLGSQSQTSSFRLSSFDPNEDLNLGCPSPGDAPRGLKIWVHVLKWCDGPRVRGQSELKLQVSIKNSGKRPLSITRTHVRLLVRRFNRRMWSPPRDGSPTIERPFKTSYQGRKVWAIPPNAEGSWDKKYASFATHWHGTTLAPGESFKPINHKRGDVVFYIPSRHKYIMHGVVGLAYVDGRDVIALCPPWRWDHKIPAGDF